MTTDEKLTPVAQQLVPALREKNRIERRSRPLTWSLVAAAVMGAAALIFLGAHAIAADEATAKLQQQGQARDQQISGIQDQLKGVCKKVANPSSLTPDERDGCFRAENSIPPPAPVTITQAAPSGSGPDYQQVQAMITSALAAVPRPLTVEQVAAVAQSVFATNASALAATPDKIASAVSSFCAGDTCRGPEGKKGADGASGAPAPPVTDAQLRAQVDAFCAENNGCVGPPGTPGVAGPQGVSVVGFDDPSRSPDDPAKCRIVAHLIDPETGRTFSQDINVPITFCVP